MGLLSGGSGDKKDDDKDKDDVKDKEEPGNSSKPSSSGEGVVEGIQKQGAQVCASALP